MSLRKEFVLRCLSGTDSMAALCREYKISRKTGYKWVARFKAVGLDGLLDESRRPKSSPLKTSADVALEILRLRKEHRTWGPKKIWGVLRRSLEPEDLPSVRTIARVLDRAGAVKRRRRYRKATGGKPARAPSFSIDGPNDLWTIDFKGWWRSKDGKRCEPLTVRDAFSRFILVVRIMPRTRARDVRKVFEELFTRYGVPKAILSDNGSPWASTKTPGGLTKLPAWWVSLGIELVRSRVGCPQDNGAHERMHADMRFEIQDNAALTRKAQQEACDVWVHEFNHVRPHEALELRTPAELYRKSPRLLERIVFGGHPPGCETVRVNTNGEFCLDGKKVYVTTALAGLNAGVQHIEGGKSIIWFYDLPLGAYEHLVDVRMEPFDFETCHQKLPPNLSEDETPASSPPGDELQPREP